MAIDREEVYTALEDLIKAKMPNDFKLVTRSHKVWNNLGVANLPALYLQQVSENQESGYRIPRKLTMNVDLYLYVPFSGLTNVIPAEIFNPLIDKLDEALKESPVTKVQNLGLKNVSHCDISGQINYYTNEQNTIAICVVPVNILVVDK